MLKVLPERLFVDSRLELDPISLKYSHELFKLVNFNRNSLREWLGWVDHVQSLSKQIALIQYYLNKWERTGSPTYCIFFEKKLAGSIGINQINWHNKSATIGYWLGEPFRGQGLMIKSCQKLISEVFAQLKLHRINICCGVGNLSSQKIPERLGFTYEGTLEEAEYLNDRYIDLRLYGLLEKEWLYEASPELKKELR